MKLMVLLFILFMCIGCAYGGNNTIDIPNPQMLEDIGLNTTIALESGDSNITFSNNMTGYCIEYREHSANVNDTFYIANTSKTVNKNDGSDVSNYLKTFFIKFHNDTLQNNLTHRGEPVSQSIFNQHIIWHFTNNFTSPVTVNSSWLIDGIVKESLRGMLSDDGYYDYDNGTRAHYHFATLLASYEEYQNFFGYRIHFTGIPDNNTTDNINETINETNTTDNNITNNQTSIDNNATLDLNMQENNDAYTSNGNKHIGLTVHKTGNSIMILLMIAVFCMGALVGKRWW